MPQFQSIARVMYVVTSPVMQDEQHHPPKFLNLQVLVTSVILVTSFHGS